MLRTVVWRVNGENLRLPGDFRGEEFRQEPAVSSSYGIKASTNVYWEAAGTFSFYKKQDQKTSTSGSSPRASDLAGVQYFSTTAVYPSQESHTSVKSLEHLGL